MRAAAWMPVLQRSVETRGPFVSDQDQGRETGTGRHPASPKNERAAPPGDTRQDGPSRGIRRIRSVFEHRLAGSGGRPILADLHGAVVSVLDRLFRLRPGHPAVLARLPIPLQLLIHQVDARVAVL